MSTPAAMSGPDHFREAERLLGEASVETWESASVASVLAARAQVHATLALAAVTLDTHTSPTALKAGKGEREWVRLLHTASDTEAVP
ncbi:MULTISPECIES: hypothetical protein [unclassified Aeromicrobium]|uniref:hypothetical protein n=1 Tax=unclassified Aeromicrobium TaxID=2633570 RepID=UPI00288BE292|nr:MULTISPECIES: hypothetical protein [unclassified Aeromicrobium]